MGREVNLSLPSSVEVKHETDYTSPNMPNKSKAMLGTLQLSSSHTSELNNRAVSSTFQKVYQQ